MIDVVWSRIVVLALIVLAVGARPVRAQETFDIDIVNNGKPTANLDVILLASSGKVPVGTTGAEGSVTVNMNLANVSKGTRVDVYEIVCGDKVVVVLVAQGQEEAFDEECERRMQENGACDCRRVPLGFFIWGDGNVTIDVGTDKVTTTSFEPTAQLGWGDLVAFGVTVGAMYWPEYENIAGSAPGATATDATTWSPGVGPFFEMGPPGTGLRVGISVTYSRGIETTQTFGNQTQTGDIQFTSIGVDARWRIGDDTARTAFYISGGGAYAWNKGDFSSAGGAEDRTHETWRAHGGLGVERYFTRRLGGWGEVRYSPPADKDDADEHVSIRVGVSVRPWWDACGGTCIR